MLVAAPVSSMKTSLLGSRSSWSSNQASRRFRMSGRSAQPHARTFFERQAAAVEEGPDGAHARLDATLRGKPLLHLHDRHVRRQFDQSEQEGALRIELGPPRLALTARHPLTAGARPAHPHNRRGDPDLELDRRPPGRHSAERSIDHTITQVLAVSSRHVPLHPQGMEDSHCSLDLGIPFRNRKNLNLL
jgi:hypothetical protein